MIFLLLARIYQQTFVILTCAYLYKFLNYESKAKSGMAEWIEKLKNSDHPKPRLIKACL